jgi:hypothetical protein
MENQANSNTDVSQMLYFKQKLACEAKIKSGFGWYYWIAAMSAINTALYLAGSTLNFVIGLGVTQILDVFMKDLVEKLGSGATFLQWIGYGVDLVIAGLFLLIGYLSNKRIRWIAIAGIVFYSLDGIILLLFRVYLAAGFHALAVLGILTGLRAMNDLKSLEQNYDPALGARFAQAAAALPAAQARPRPRLLRVVLWTITGVFFSFLLIFVIFLVANS